MDCLSVEEPISTKVVKRDASGCVQRIDNHTDVQSVELGVSSLLLERCIEELNWTGKAVSLNRSGDGPGLFSSPEVKTGATEASPMKINLFPIAAVVERRSHPQIQRIGEAHWDSLLNPPVCQQPQMGWSVEETIFGHSTNTHTSSGGTPPRARFLKAVSGRAYLAGSCFELRIVAADRGVLSPERVGHATTPSILVDVTEARKTAHLRLRSW